MLSINRHVSSSDRIEYVFSDSDWVSDVCGRFDSLGRIRDVRLVSGSGEVLAA